MDAVEHDPIANGKINRAKRMALRDSWIAEFADHRRIHNESRFRWWADDVMSIVTWNTRGRIDFTELKHLAWLEEWRLNMGSYTDECAKWVGVPLLEAQSYFRWTREYNQLGEVVGLTPRECDELVYWWEIATERTPNQQVRRIHKMAFSNPLIRIWELKQLWRMYQAAVDVAEDTLVDLVEELRPTHRLSDIVRESRSFTEGQLNARVTEARDARGGPNDPRRVPHQIFM